LDAFDPNSCELLVDTDACEDDSDTEDLLRFLDSSSSNDFDVRTPETRVFVTSPAELVGCNADFTTVATEKKLTLKTARYVTFLRDWFLLRD
jgi:hypothetical protein